MKVYAIFANDNTKGTSYKLFKQATATLQEQGHEVDILLLYDRENEIPFFRHDQTTMESYPFYHENKQRFLQADQILIVFPLFWYSVPAILKAWLDMINAWAYRYEQGMYANPLHKINHVLAIYSSMQSAQHMKENLNSPVEHQLSETCKFIGVPTIDIYHVDQVTSLTEDIMKQHLKRIEKLCIDCKKKGTQN